MFVIGKALKLRSYLVFPYLVGASSDVVAVVFKIATIIFVFFFHYFLQKFLLNVKYLRLSHENGIRFIEVSRHQMYLNGKKKNTKHMRNIKPNVEIDSCCKNCSQRSHTVMRLASCQFRWFATFHLIKRVPICLKIVVIGEWGFFLPFHVTIRKVYCAYSTSQLN